jgi:transposase
VLTSMPGVGARTTGVLLLTLGDDSTFATVARLTAYAGLAPVTRQSGRTIRGERQPRRGNRALKSALYFVGLRQSEDPPPEPGTPRTA